MRKFLWLRLYLTILQGQMHYILRQELFSLTPLVYEIGSFILMKDNNRRYIEITM